MKIKLFLAIIFLLGFTLRFYNLASNPPALTWDEVAWGFNAYSIGASGRDEFGKFLPITYLESFGDFKPPVYAYLSVIPVWILGLNEFSVRFASAFFGSLTVFLTYFLVNGVFYSSKKKSKISLIAALLIAISPWHILLSRAAFEANVATFFIVLGTTLFLYAVRKKLNARLFLFSLLSFVLAMYTFNTSRVFLPLFVIFLCFSRRSVLFASWRKTLLTMALPFFMSIPLLLFMLTPQAQLRYKEVNIFTDISVIERTNQEMANSNNSFTSRIIHNRRLAYAVEYFNHYLDNLDPIFLFVKGDGNPKFSIQDVGQLYIWELPFVLIGILYLFYKKEGFWQILPVWILLGIIPAATARETPHALRIETIVPSLQIICAYGIFTTIVFVQEKVPFKNLKRFIWVGWSLAIVFFFFYFLHNYFNHYPITYAQEWQYGYKQAVEFVESQKNKYNTIYFTQDLGRPYIYALFYGKYPGNALVDAKIERENAGFVHVHSFGKYDFRKELPGLENDMLYVNIPSKVPESAHVLKIIAFPNGEASLVIYEK